MDNTNMYKNVLLIMLIVKNNIMTYLVPNLTTLLIKYTLKICKDRQILIDIRKITYFIIMKRSKSLHIKPSRNRINF